MPRLASKHSRRLFGTQIDYVWDVLSNYWRPHAAGTTNSAQPLGTGVSERTKDQIRVLMQVLVTVLSLVFGFRILSHNTNPEIHKYVTGMMGLVIGYWLR